MEQDTPVKDNASDYPMVAWVLTLGSGALVLLLSFGVALFGLFAAGMARNGANADPFMRKCLLVSGLGLLIFAAIAPLALAWIRGRSEGSSPLSIRLLTSFLWSGVLYLGLSLPFALLIGLVRDSFLGWVLIYLLGLWIPALVTRSGWAFFRSATSPGA